MKARQIKENELWGQRTQLACLIDKDDDFRAELELFAPILECISPALQGLFK